MATESPLRDIMIEVITNESVPLDTIRVAGEVIASDAAFCSRMADLQGHSDPKTYFGGIKLYQQQIDCARTAWATYKSAVASAADRVAEAEKALSAVLSSIRDTLQHAPT